MLPLILRGLTKSYGGARVVDGLDLELEPGRCHGLLGPNGAGKTTTLRLALGLIGADAGSVDLLGYPMPAQAALARRKVGVVPQIDSLAGKADAPINNLSGGMKRRLTLARALVNDPDLIFLDEPTTGLDPQARHLIWQGLRRLIGQGRTLLLTTHFMDEAERLCDVISVLDQGRVIVRGSPRELIRQHIEPHVVEIFGDGLSEWQTCASTFCRRCETAGETLFCYTDAPEKVVEELENHPGLRYLHRPANLEDVFLKLTGRDLRD